MRHRQAVLAVLLLGPLAGWSCGAHEAPPAATTAAPDACASALAPSSGHDDTDRQIARAQQQARQEPGARRALERLGYLYVSRARARHDAGDYVLAERAAACLAGRNPDDTAALLLRGHAMHQLHRFAEAEEIARRLVSERGLALDYGLLGDALVEQGRVADAADAYQRMIDLKPFYQSYTRAAHLRWLRGDLDGAIELLRLAVGAASPRDPESIAWAYARLAAHELQAGRLRKAEQAADAALAHQPDYATALLARGRILLARQRTRESVDALRRAAALNPLPEYQWALADALRLAGADAEAADVERTLTRDGVRSDPRTVALFLATKKTAAADAVSLARAEMAVRADVFTLDALAWSLAAAGDADAAAPFMTRALAEGTQDGRLFVHAAAIAAAGGRPAEARRWADKAHALRSMLLPSEIAELTAVRNGLSTTQEIQP